MPLLLVEVKEKAVFCNNLASQFVSLSSPTLVLRRERDFWFWMEQMDWSGQPATKIDSSAVDQGRTPNAASACKAGPTTHELL
jgi:hypothetical protein